MSSLSEHERVGLEEVFMCLGEKAGIKERLKEQKNHIFSRLSFLAKKSVPLGVSYVKSKKIIFKQKLKVDKNKLFKHFSPKDRGCK